MIKSLVPVTLASAKGFVVPSVYQRRCILREMSLSSTDGTSSSNWETLKEQQLQHLQNVMEVTKISRKNQALVISLITNMLESWNNQIQIKDELIEIKDKLIQTKDKRIQTKDKLIQTKDKLIQTTDKGIQGRDQVIQAKDDVINFQDSTIIKLRFDILDERSRCCAVEQTRTLVEMAAIFVYPGMFHTAATDKLVRSLFENYEENKLCDDAKEWLRELTGEEIISRSFERSVCKELKGISHTLSMDIHVIKGEPFGHYIGVGKRPTRAASTLAVLKAQSTGKFILGKLTYLDENNKPSRIIVNDGKIKVYKRN